MVEWYETREEGAICRRSGLTGFGGAHNCAVHFCKAPGPSPLGLSSEASRRERLPAQFSNGGEASLAASCLGPPTHRSLGRPGSAASIGAPYRSCQLDERVRSRTVLEYHVLLLRTRTQLLRRAQKLCRPVVALEDEFI